ncbi:DUF397 domain-containing protein [Streptomyces albidoflavus]
MAIEPDWRTSSYTKSDNCVEVADNAPPVILVRDTKDREAGFLALRQGAWVDFVRYIKRRNS